MIVSDETIRNLIEAHASMAAWYYQMAGVLREQGIAVEPPSDADRKAYVAQLALHFPELAAAAHALTEPRAYVPPPAIASPANVTENEGVEIAPPPDDHLSTPALIPGPPSAPPSGQAAAQAAEQAAEQPASPPSGAPPPPPPIVDPSKVKYE